MPDQPMLPEGGLIHSEYLPFTTEQLSQHFATIISTDSGSAPEGRSRHLAYFLAFAQAGRDLDATASVGTAADRARPSSERGRSRRMSASGSSPA